jgi:tRNA(Ile)-lysidine synthase
MLPLSLQRHLLRRASARLSKGQSALELRHYPLLEQLMQHPYHGEALSLDMPGKLRALRQGDTLTLIANGPAPVRAENIPVTLTIPGRATIPGTPWQARAELVPVEQSQAALFALRQDDWPSVWRILEQGRYRVYLDGECVGKALLIRTRRPGDRMRPLGMAHEKKVQDVLVDRHIARTERDSIPLFFNANHCLWLAGIEIDERARLTSRSQQIICLTLDRD